MKKLNYVSFTPVLFVFVLSASFCFVKYSNYSNWSQKNVSDAAIIDDGSNLSMEIVSEKLIYSPAVPVWTNTSYHENFGVPSMVLQEQNIHQPVIKPRASINLAEKEGESGGDIIDIKIHKEIASLQTGFDCDHDGKTDESMFDPDLMGSYCKSCQKIADHYQSHNKSIVTVKQLCQSLRRRGFVFRVALDALCHDCLMIVAYAEDTIYGRMLTIDEASKLNLGDFSDGAKSAGYF